MITSRKNPGIQQIRALLSKKSIRQASGQCVLEGVRLLEEALDAGWKPVFGFYADLQGDRNQALLQRLFTMQADMQEVPQDLLAYTADTENPQGIVAVFEIQKSQTQSQPTFVFVLDAIRDPGNMGTLLRTAAAAGVDFVLLTSDCVDPYSPKVLRAGMGAHFRLPIQQWQPEEIIKYCKQSKLNIFIADSNAERACWGVDFRPALALVIGNEANGPSGTFFTPESQPITIPMPGGFESLNAAMAGGILLFEIVRQRQP